MATQSQVSHQQQDTLLLDTAEYTQTQQQQQAAIETRSSKQHAETYTTTNQSNGSQN